jgi:putative transposase
MMNHVHLIVSSRDGPLDGIMRDSKRHTSTLLRTAIEKQVAESRREWMVELFTKVAKEIVIIAVFNCGSSTTGQ